MVRGPRFVAPNVEEQRSSIAFTNHEEAAVDRSGSDSTLSLSLLLFRTSHQSGTPAVPASVGLSVVKTQPPPQSTGTGNSTCQVNSLQALISCGVPLLAEAIEHFVPLPRTPRSLAGVPLLQHLVQRLTQAGPTPASSAKHNSERPRRIPPVHRPRAVPRPRGN
jgi:hypothetical protein